MNTILEGKNGCGKRAKALTIAGDILKADPETSASFLMVEPDEKGLLAIAKVAEISEFCSYAGEKVAVVTNLHKGTEKFQQSLLKLLEDTDDCSFIITTEGELLDTIYSRCTRRFIRPLSVEDVRKGIEEKYGSVDERAFRISGNSLSIYERLVGEDKLLDKAVAILDLIKTPSSGRKLMDALGVTPDGTNNFYGLFGQGMTGLLLDAVSRELLQREQWDAAWYMEENKSYLLRNYTKSLWCNFWNSLYERL